MRRRFTVPLIAAVAALPWFWFHPETPPADQPATLLSVLNVPRDAEWVGGLSGIEITADGSQFYMVTDRGHMARGSLNRRDQKLIGMEITAFQPILDHFGQEPEFPHTDAEGLALSAQGRLYISFEHAHRVLYYNTWASAAQWPSYTRAWRALPSNQGLEALAVDGKDTLFAIPEEINSGAFESLVYTRKPRSNWGVDMTLPIDPTFAPVGADFGPDGKFYVLERGLYPFGFYSRVRVMSLSDEGFRDIETVLQTTLGAHGNLEGIAVWRDQTGLIRLTMVSDDNFLPFMRGQIVEYVLADRVARTAQ